MEFFKSITTKQDQNSDGKSTSIMDNVKSWKWFGFKVNENGQSIDAPDNQNTTLDDEETEDEQLTEENIEETLTKGKEKTGEQTKSDNFHLFKDIDYYVEKDKHKKHKLNVYVPNGVGTNELLPVVVHVHGGGWKRGDRDTEFYGAPFMGRAYANRGFVCITVSYRLNWTASHPAQIIDVSRAMKWAVNNIQGFHGDVTKLFLSGHSAGGHLVSLLTTDPSYLQAQGVNPDVIKGVISISGIYSLHDALLESTEGSCQKGTWWNAMFHMRYVNGNFGKDPTQWHQASPIYHVNDIIAKLNSMNLENSNQNDSKKTNDNTENNKTQQQVESTQKEPSTEESKPTAEENSVLETELSVSSPPLIVSNTRKLPPFLVISAEWDMGLEFGAARFHATLQKAGVSSTHTVVPATHHGSVTRCNETADHAVAFIKEVLSKM